MNIIRGFLKQPQDDPSKIINFMDEDKPLSKKYSFLISYIDKISKQEENFSLRLFDFFKENHENIQHICTTHILQQDSKFKIKSWEEALNTFSILEKFTRYGQCRKIEQIQNISRSLLLDGNRLEIKKIGLSLIMNIITHNENLRFPFDIFIASVDLSLVDIKSQTQLANREILARQDFKWLNSLKDLTKGLQPYPYNELVKISQSTQNFEMIKENLVLFREILKFTLQGGISEQGVSIFSHFKKWFDILRGSYFLYLYPDLTEREFGKGFDKCPDSIHYLVIDWISELVIIEDICSYFFLSENDRNFILKLLEKSFHWVSPGSANSLKSAYRSLKVLMNWLNYINYPTLREISKENFLILCLTHASCIFTKNIKNFSEKTDLCLRSQELFKIFNQNFKDNSSFFKLILEICEGLNPVENNEKIIENFSLFLIKVLKTANWTKLKILKDFEFFLHKWAERFVVIFQIWKRSLIEIIDSSKDFSALMKTPILEIFKLIGSVTEFDNARQSEWSSAVHELILNMIEKKIPPFEVLKIFFPDLSKLVLYGGNDSSMISLNTVCQVFSRDSKKTLSSLQTRHFFYLISESIGKGHLIETILRHTTVILDYKGMHALIDRLISLACQYPAEGIQTIFRVFSLPNYYKSTSLLGINGSKSDYFSLKPKIFTFFSAVNIKDPPISYINGLGVFLIEEISNKFEEFIEDGIDILLNYSLHPNTEICCEALQMISMIVPVLLSKQMKILNFLVSKVLKPKKVEKENLVVQIIDTIVTIFMSLKEKVDEEIMKIFFQRISKFGVIVKEKSSLKEYLNTVIGFLGFYYLNFPLQYTTVEVFETCKDCQIEAEEHYVLNKSTIISIKKDKFLIRNQFGKFLWSCQNFSIFNSELFTDDKNNLRRILNRSQVSLPGKVSAETLKNSPSIEFLTLWIQKTYSNNPPNLLAKDLELPVLPPQLVIHERKQTNFIEQDETVKNISKIFLSNSGLDTDLKKIKDCEKFNRSINLLDALKSREQVKIGILYVKPGQDCEKEILANSNCSNCFKSFLENIGKTVELENYLCYLGGLDPKGTCGKYSISYVDWEYDIMFHVPVLMPTNPSDPQQVLKKRHVGNDMVIIVWSENSKEYRTDTILTHLNIVNIIIYPLDSQLFRISIQNKLNLSFGPLRNGMVLNWKTLPYLVRITAINANRAIKATMFPNVERQTRTRQKRIKEIYEEYCFEKVGKTNN